MSSIQSYCRLCGALKSSAKLMNLLEDSDAREEITRKLHRINAVVDFTSNILPQTVCSVCITDLGRAFDFVFNVEKVQADLCYILSEKIKEDLVCAEEGSIWEPEVEIQYQVGSNSDDGDNLADLHSPSSVTLHEIEYLESDEIEDVKPNIKQIKESESPETRMSESKENISKSSSLVALEVIEYQGVKPCKQNLKKSQSPEPEMSNITENILLYSTEKNLGNTCEAVKIPQQAGPWKNFKWTCNICNTEFTTRKELNSHAMKFHDCCNPYRCNDCGKKVSSLKNFIKHIKKHPERKNLKYSCYICFKQYSSKEIKSYPKKHYLNMQHFCEGCHTVFNDERELEKHTNSYLKSLRPQLLNRVKHLIDQTEGLTCLICQKTSKNSFILQRHLLIHLDREKKYTCDTCGKCFVEKCLLTQHLIIHSNERPFQCEICKANFKTLVILRRHVGTHNSTTPFKCKDCERSFKHKKALNAHRLRAHSGRSFVCKFCSKAFRAQDNLNIHLRQHTGLKPYSCTICDREFTNWSNHNKHMKTRHGVDTAKKKLTSAGTLLIDTVTGQLVIPKKTEQMLEWDIR